jgi:hypothetical protein
MAGAAAEPPITVRCKVGILTLLSRMKLSSPSQTVGTPAARVTPSSRISSNSDLPSSAGPGNTSLAPVSAAA